VNGDPERVVAGVDLGSNSFHMIVARAEEGGRVHVLDRIRDPVRLAAGLDDQRTLTQPAIDRALSALQRFGERLRGLPEGSVLAVGTNTMRQARNGTEFLERAQAVLGHPIEIISGHEEARLIYLGVAHTVSDDVGRHLVIDVGGGSTELVIGERFETVLLDSLFMGCVSFTNRFFANGAITRDHFRRAEIAAGLEFWSLREQYRRTGWQRATGSSGTALAVHEVLRQNRWGEAITLDGLKKLKQEMVTLGNVSRLQLKGLEPDRAAVFPGGVAILKAAFESLGIDAMHPSSGALREGLVYELLGRRSHEDVRDRTIRTFVERYRVDTAHAERVRQTALALFAQAATGLELDPGLGVTFLEPAARLHEIGLSISYSGHHKHAAYILAHADMPGFSKEQQTVLSEIVHAHRRKISRDYFAGLAKHHRKPAFLLAVLLRLAVRLHHSRSPEAFPEIRLNASKTTIELGFPEGWLDEHPLARADLDEEAEQLKPVGLTLIAR
jgi:exopolyphosphatase/guanosine-5'-triphosphate,3'-diphosphate pyrophosphatase